MEWIADSRSRLATLHRNSRRIFSHTEKWFHPQFFLHETDAAFCRPQSRPEPARPPDIPIAFPGKEVCTEFNDPATAAEIEWCGIVRDGSNYFRQQITIHTATPLPITDVRILQFKDANAHVVGSVKGSPIADHTMFFGFEHPLSTSHVQAGEVLASLPRRCPCSRTKALSIPPSLELHDPGKCAATFSATSNGSAPIPIARSLHYNSWYDLGYFNAPTKPARSNRIHAFGQELTEKRGVTMDIFLFDDGWDNPTASGDSTPVSRWL